MTYFVYVTFSSIVFFAFIILHPTFNTLFDHISNSMFHFCLQHFNFLYSFLLIALSLSDGLLSSQALNTVIDPRLMVPYVNLGRYHPP